MPVSIVSRIPATRIAYSTAAGPSSDCRNRVIRCIRQFSLPPALVKVTQRRDTCSGNHTSVTGRKQTETSEQIEFQRASIRHNRIGNLPSCSLSVRATCICCHNSGEILSLIPERVVRFSCALTNALVVALGCQRFLSNSRRLALTKISDKKPCKDTVHALLTVYGCIL